MSLVNLDNYAGGGFALIQTISTVNLALNFTAGLRTGIQGCGKRKTGLAFAARIFIVQCTTLLFLLSFITSRKQEKKQKRATRTV